MKIIQSLYKVLSMLSTLSSNIVIELCLVHIDVMLPFLTKLCNVTILEGGLPESQRTAIVVPRLKGSGLDPADVKSHRPISNLSFMSKVIEWVIFRQLVVYLDSNNLVPKYQSGIRKHHSTESATLRVLSDIYIRPLTTVGLPSSPCWMSALHSTWSIMTSWCIDFLNHLESSVRQMTGSHPLSRVAPIKTMFINFIMLNST